MDCSAKKIILPDLLEDKLKLVVCGFAAGNKSARLGKYYADPGNKFWKTLFEVGLTTCLIAPQEYERILNFKIGLTDLIKHKSGMDDLLSPSNFDREELRKKIEKWQPTYLCFNGKRSAKEFLLRKVQYGLQCETIGATHIFVAPSTSGAAGRWWDIAIWRELAGLCANNSL